MGLHYLCGGGYARHCDSEAHLKQTFSETIRNKNLPREYRRDYTAKRIQPFSKDYWLNMDLSD